MKHTVEEIQLKSGARGLLVDVADAPVMSFNFNFRAGYFTSPENKWEVPHVLEHLMFNGNEYLKTARDFNVALEKNGAYANAFTGNWYVGYDSECAEFESMRVLELVLQSLAKPLFLPDEFKAEMGNVREELSGYLNNYFRVLNVAMMENANQLALNDSERLKQLRNISPEDMFAHHQKTHTKQNLRFVIGGRTQEHRQEILDLLEEYSAQLPDGDRFELPSESPNPKGDTITMYRGDVEKLHYYFDLYLPKRRLSEDEITTSHVLERILTKSMTSRIFGEARRRGMAYGVSSSMSTGVDNSRWWFGGNVNESNIAELLTLIVDQVSDMAKGNITDDEVKAAKLQELGNFQRSSQKVSDLTRGYEGRYYFDDIYEDFNNIPDRIKAVTKQEIHDLVTLFVDQNAWDLGLLGKTDDNQAKSLAKICRELFN